MAFKIFGSTNTPKVGARLIADGDITDIDGTKLIRTGTGFKITSVKKKVAFGELVQITIPAGIPLIGNKVFRVQSGIETVDELGRSNNIEQVQHTEVRADELDNASVLKYDALARSVKERGCNCRIGWRIEPNRDFFNFRSGDEKLLDIPRYDSDNLYSVEFPDDESIPFTIVGVDIGCYENGYYLSKSDLNIFDRMRLINKRIGFTRHYKVQGPFVDNYTYSTGDRTYETNETTIFVPVKTVEQRFKLWMSQSNSEGHRLAA